MKVQKVGLIALACLGIAFEVARGDHRTACGPLVTLADQMQDHARALSCEFERSYRWTQQYWDLQSNAQRISVSAGQLKLLAQAGGDLREMKCELDAITAANRNLGQLVCGPIAASGQGPHHTAWRYEPPVCQNDQVRRTMKCLETSICQASEQLSQLLGPVDVSVHRPGHGRDYYRRPVYVYSPYSRGPVTSSHNPRVAFYIGR